MTARPLHLSSTVPDSPPMEPLLTAAEVATLLGVRLKRVYELGIPAVRLSAHTLRWERSDVIAWKQSRKEQTPGREP